MITQIRIRDLATYKDGVELYPKRVNFLYGGNGTGKTTFSKLLSGELSSSECSIEWSPGEHEEVVVYNRSFVEHNFSADIAGIFTLGKESVETQRTIEEHRLEISRLRDQENDFSRDIGKLLDKKQTARESAENACWEIQQKYGSEFSDALVGFRGSKAKFFGQCIAVYPSLGTATILTYDELKRAYDVAFAKNAQKYPEYPLLDLDELGSVDTCELLSQVITGSGDTPVGMFISFLGAGDWVRRGIEYAKRTEGKCPYCQQALSSNLQSEIEHYFDEEYSKACELLKSFYTDYCDATARALTTLLHISDHHYPALDYKEFDLLSARLKTICESNYVLIKKKIDEPSQPVEFYSIVDICHQLNNLIDRFNTEIRNNNQIVDNQSAERNRIKTSLWFFLSNELKTTIDGYLKANEGFDKGIESLEQKIRTSNNRRTELSTTVEEMEARITSVTPTVTAINRILEGFDFTGFKLAEHEEKKGTYVIVRPDGQDARQTLSEGEYNFICFLYFYQLCFGSQNRTGVTKEKILIIDDPISSLDSNVLFIVSTLVKSILHDCVSLQNGIKQVFVLTHNVYFHKEITFGGRSGLPSTVTQYYIVRKKDNVSNIIPYAENPVQTSYEMLWEELRHPDQHSKKSIFNTMRRILEHYFQVIGGIKYEECINHFEGEDKLICKSLVACINDGSHTIFDDLVMCFEEEAIDKHIRVFKMIFENMNQASHYNMMMRIEEPSA